MKLLSTKAHGVLDYLMGGLLIALPWLLGFADGTPAQWVPVVLGISMIIMALCTTYEMGVANIISMKTHLTIDFISGLLLAFSPWLFQFADQVYVPHLLLGIAEIGAAVVTETVPHRKHVRA